MDQAATLRELLARNGFSFTPKPYTLYFAQKEKLTAAVYEKGPKLVLQGRGAGEFVQFHLEPEVLGEAKLGYEELHNPEMFSAHFGIDESGKGDFFGPLVIAGVYVDRGIARIFMEAGITDSKRIGSDKKIRDLAKLIKTTHGAVHSVVEIGPPKYNEMIARNKNLNRVLAWGHARVIENLLGMRADCPRALSDQFANPKMIENALMEHGKKIVLEQRTKAESDFAVAAASILARERFIDWLQKAGVRFQKTIPRGVSALVKQTARELAAEHSPEILRELTKTHFKTASEIAPEIFPHVERPPFQKRA
ncbi:MAG: ribonuclease [Chthoniobacter sp.]|nr:ribonuclease [Chthoniobacter sp.]